MKNVLIVGYGVVGKNLHKELSKLNPDIYDKYNQAYNTKKDIKYDFAFICVDTPKTEDSSNDISEVINAIRDNDAKIYIIKSTILPGTVENLTIMFLEESLRKCRTNELAKHIVFSPEYYGGTQHCNNFEFNFTILGGEKSDCLKVQQLLQHVYDARHSFRIVSAKLAELVKYMENSWLATKVSFCNQFYQIAQEYAVRYEELRELFILDPRVNPSHTFVDDESPYWDSHCLNKDVPAIAEAVDAELLKAVIEFNKKQKEKHKTGN